MTRTAEDIVRSEVCYCVSGLVSTLSQSITARFESPERDLASLCEQAFELAAPIEDWEEAAVQERWSWDEGGPHFYRVNNPDASAFEPYDYYRAETCDWRDLCEAHDIDPYQREVYEHWIVSDWLADHLEAKGEKVDKDFAGMTVWARTTTGQGISIDSVIAQITADLNA